MPATHRPHSPHLRRPQPVATADPGAASAARRTSCHVRRGCRTGHHLSAWQPACGSRPDTPVWGGKPPRTRAWLPPPALPHARHRPSGRQSFRKQRRINPPIAPTRYNFLFSPSRPALRAAGGRPPVRQRHDGRRATGLTDKPRRMTAAPPSQPYTRCPHYPSCSRPARAAPQAPGPGVPAHVRHAHALWRPGQDGRDVPAARPPAHAS
jgi:hypothetical protein